MRRSRGRQIALNAIALGVFAVMIFPVYWMVSTAFQPTDSINRLTPSWFPAHPTLQHFRDAMNRPYFWNSVVNSVTIVGITVAISIVLAFLAAVALAKFRFSGRKLFIVLLIGIQMLPQAGLIIDLSADTDVGVKALEKIERIELPAVAVTGALAMLYDPLSLSAFCCGE